MIYACLVDICDYVNTPNPIELRTLIQFCSRLQNIFVIVHAFVVDSSRTLRSEFTLLNCYWLCSFACQNPLHPMVSSKVSKLRRDF